MTADFRIVNFNYVNQPSVDIQPTSENVNYPASNLASEFRSKVWRSSGYFVITASNNKINFKESIGGPELTATLTVGNYSVSTLALELKTQLENIGAKTYTVSQSASTGKWTIATTGDFEIYFSTGTNAGTSCRDVIGFGTNDFTGSSSYTGPKTAIHTEEAIVFDLQSSEEIDSFAMFFDPKTGVKLSDSAQVYFQANATNLWTSPAVSILLTRDDNWDTYSLFLATAIEYRYFRVKIVDPENYNLYVELGTIVLGKYELLNRCADNGFELIIDDGTKTFTNEYGNTYVDTYPFIKEINFNFNLLTYDQQKVLENTYRFVGTSSPILVALDTQEELFDKDHFLVYGRFQDKLNFKHLVKSYFSSGIKIRESL